MDILLHSYSFRGHSFETAVQYARRFGYDGVELSRVHCHDSRMGEELGACIGVANRYGVSIGCVDFKADLISESEKVVYDSVSRLEGNIELCGARGIGLMNGFVGVLQEKGKDYSQNGSALAADGHYARAGDSLRYLGEVAERHGVTLTLEIHMNTPHDTIASAKRLIEAADHPRIRVNPDPANMFAVCKGAVSPEELDSIASEMALFHFKNCRRVGKAWDYSVRLADGFIDTFGYVRKLDELGYDGPVCIEYTGEGDPRAMAKDDIAYLRGCLELIRDGLG